MHVEFMDKEKENPIMSPLLLVVAKSSKTIWLLALLVWLLKRWNHQVERIG
jgi:hypothetical protein